MCSDSQDSQGAPFAEASLWALVSGHGSAWQAARVEVNQQAEAKEREAEDLAGDVVERMVAETDVSAQRGGVLPFAIARSGFPSQHFREGPVGPEFCCDPDDHREQSMTADEYAPALSQFAGLIHEKAWEHLGMTGDEFTRAWYAGQFQDDDRPIVQSLDRLMRTGHWGPTERDRSA